MIYIDNSATTRVSDTVLAAIPNLNEEENIILPFLLDGKDMKEYRQNLNEILNIVGLTERLGHTPGELSGRQQQRVTIDCALINERNEIASAYATHARTQSRSFCRFNRAQGKTVLMVTHSKDAAAYGNRMIYTRDGVVEQ